MQKLTILLTLCICLSACKASKSSKHSQRVSQKNSKKVTSKPSTDSVNPKIDAIVSYAQTFEGVRYKYGGTTKSGMDCSGLVTTAFKSENIALPRTTSNLALSGNWVDLKEVQKGDLLFFATKKNSRDINHVGIVTDARTGFVEFIHASTSSGVIVSKLSERYWYFSFVQARRIL